LKPLLVDTGPLVALLDADDAAHGRCVEHLKGVRVPLVTTWPVVTEAMYLLGASWIAQQALLEMITGGSLRIEELQGSLGRIEHLMAKYRDVPMDFGDASLVAIAEEKGWDAVFTLDSDFRVYRLGGRRAFEVAP
jgi:predicted nucleic acid-binding protein